MPKRAVALGYPNRRSKWSLPCHTTENSQVAKLRSLDISWALSKDVWEEAFGELALFAADHGHCDVPRKDMSVLSDWVADQRAAWRNDALSPEQEQRLEALGLVWEHTQVQWDRFFLELVAFHQEYGHCAVPQRCAPSAERKGVRRN